MGFMDAYETKTHYRFIRITRDQIFCGFDVSMTCSYP